MARELLDDDAGSGDELAANLRDIERANRWFGTLRAVAAFVWQSGARTVLDVGCGTGGVALALLSDAQRRGRQLHVTGLERSTPVLSLARERAKGHSGLSLVEGDGEALPYSDHSFDVVICTLTLHHCEPKAAVRLLCEMRRVARIAPFLCDLRRSRMAYLGALAFAYLSSRNRLTRHDAPLSVERAYTPAEALQLAQIAHWNRPVVRASPFFRMTVYDA
ncbi:MAG: methyltransferase domain-containing protein [Candidatus Eremiobacteraeota bacterium]|nr:methyltransferase domain-containing protein [Candidatus Eremiobacteraeota bacterium]MBV9647838.1 methyltransferase domain-containing protein [Candidatus Eremiobacteraeota bacterium]